MRSTRRNLSERSLALVCALASSGCHSEPTTTSSAPSATPSVSATLPAARPPPAPAPSDAADGGLLTHALPRTQYRGGRFLRSPRIVTVTFTKDDPKLVARLELLSTTITHSSWWHEVTDGYCTPEGECIGEGLAGSAVRLDDALAADVSDDDVEAILARAATANRLGPLDANTMLLVYLPKGVGFRDRAGKYCEKGPRGFHRSTDVTKEKRVALAIVPRCGSEAETTGTASHEILEATTNPFPAERGFAFLGGNTMSGFTFGGVEPVDPCGVINMSTHWTTESGFVLQRAWSNRAAAAGRDPCVPTPPGAAPYALLVPREPAVRLQREGESVTIDLDATAGDGVATWAVAPFDVTGFQDRTAYVDASLDKAMVRAGDNVKLTVTLKKRAPGNKSLLGLVSTVGVHSHMWPIVMVTR